VSRGSDRRRLLGAGAAASLLALAGRLPALAVAPETEPTPAADEPLYAAPTTLDRVGRVMAPVMVDGQGPFRFIVDTGATRSALSPALVARLGLPTDRSPPVRMQGVTGEAIVPTVRIGRLQAGSLLLRDQDLPVLEPQVFAQADGILGIEGMAGNRLDIDFVADRVTLSRSRDQRAEPGFLVVPVYRRAGGLLIVDARIGRVRGRAIIDTGAERTLGNPELQRRLAQHPGDDGEAGRPTQVYGATAAVTRGESRIAPAIRIGEASLDNLEITFADLHVFRYWKLDQVPALLIGMDLLGVVARLVVDYRRAEIHLGYRR
jgi:predicted aspartyl protease